MTPHKHAKLIKAWADGAEIEFYDKRFDKHQWKLSGPHPLWDENVDYRIKPQPKPDVCMWVYVNRHTGAICLSKNTMSIPIGFEILGKFKLEQP